MIPEFDEHGYLPPGVHPATLAETEERFGTGSEIRQVQCESLKWLVESARRAGVERILVNGSFVTDAVEPNEMDCLLLIGDNFPIDAEAERELQEGLPFLDIELADAPTFDFYVDRFYATDRLDIPRGLVAVLM